MTNILFSVFFIVGAFILMYGLILILLCQFDVLKEKALSITSNILTSLVAMLFIYFGIILLLGFMGVIK